MIIIYTQGRPDSVVLGKGWEASRWRKPKDTDIVRILWQTIVANQKILNFEELTEIIKETYKTKTVKSRIDIYYRDTEIEIIKKGVFPNILIEKI